MDESNIEQQIQDRCRRAMIKLDMLDKFLEKWCKESADLLQALKEADDV